MINLEASEVKRYRIFSYLLISVFNTYTGFSIKMESLCYVPCVKAISLKVAEVVETSHALACYYCCCIRAFLFREKRLDFSIALPGGGGGGGGGRGGEKRKNISENLG